MYPNPHNKISGRKYTDNPAEGIPLALSILNDVESHRDDIMAAACYLAYRALDGSYFDFEFAWKKLIEARQLANSMTDDDPAWFRTRWIVSLTLISSYYQLIVFKKPLVTDELKLVVSEQHVLNHPPQIVNIIRASFMLAANEFFSKRKLGMGPAHRAINKYCIPALKLYKLAVEKYQIEQDKEHVFIYEAGDAMEALTSMMEIKFSVNPGTEYPLEKILAKWEDDVKAGKSRKSYRLALLQIYKNNEI